MSIPVEYTSFLIRLWREVNPDPHAPPAEWHGEVEHIQSDRRWAFSSLDEVLAFLRRQAEKPDELPSPPSKGCMPKVV